MQRLEKSFSSLVVCYAFLASLAALLLIYVRLELQANPPDWSNLIGGLVHGSISLHAVNGAQILDGARSALVSLRERMHTTWLFLVVFAVVWLACLVWMEVERRRRGLRFTGGEGFWIFGFTVAVSAVAVLYGLGTNGILARRFPGVIPVSDVVALGFILALPLAVWVRLDRLQEQEEDAELDEEPQAAGRSRGFLGLNDDATNARLVENFSRLEVKPVDLLPAVQAFHPEAPSEYARARATSLIERAEAPAQASEPVPAPAETAPVSAVEPVSGVNPPPNAGLKLGGTGIESFRQHLATMNQSWQHIETLRREIDNWFEERRREAIAHLDMHPGMRTSAIERTLTNDFPNEKLAAIDAEWAQIRDAVLEISRWFGEVSGPDQRK